MQKLRDNSLEGIHVFKDLKYGIIQIWLKDINQAAGALHALNVPHACYEIIYDDAIIVIDTPIYEKALEIESNVGVNYAKA